MVRSLAFASLAVVSLTACEREPLPEICPNIEVGDLVISELRGNNEAFAADWIEVHNTSTSTIDLLGLVVRLRLGNGTIVRFLIRESVELPAGGYLAAGPMEADWLYPTREVPKLFNDVYRGYVEIEGCDDEVLDTVEFLALPSKGTLACGNAQSPPDIDANDDTATGCWCVDESMGGPQLLVGFGSPGEPNRCP